MTSTKLTDLEVFLLADDDRRFELLNDAAMRDAARSWMGEAAFQQFEALRPAKHLGAGPKNIVFAPGVMGSTLQSNGLGGVWWLDVLRARDKLDRLQLSADGTVDADPDADIQPGAVDLSYIAFRRAIAVSGGFGGTVQFPYDWRKSLRISAGRLRDIVLQTHADFGKPVHLVGHSMGGLMIRTALMLHGQELWPKIGRIVFIATPHYGSPSIAGYLKNHLWGWEQIAVLGMFLSRQTFRTLRGCLSLLPAPSGVYPGTRNGEAHPCANFDMYDALAWKLELDAASTVHLQGVLDEVKQFHTDLYQWHSSLLQDRKERMLMIAGVGEETLFRIQFDTALWGKWERTKKMIERTPCDVNFEGDGRVPLASAQIEDVTVRYVKGEHGALPNIPAVARDVLSWLNDGELELPRSCKAALSKHLSAEDTVSESPALDGSGTGSRFRELANYENSSREFRTKIEADLDAGKLPGMNFVRIL